MADPFRRVTTGEFLKPSAAAWNAMLEAAKRDRERENSQRREKNNVSSDRSICLIQNATGSDVEPFQILAIDGTCFTPPVETDAKELWAMDLGLHLTLSGVVPDVLFHLGRFVVTLDYIKAGAVGRCMNTGIGLVRLDVANVGHQWADVTNGDVTKLTTGDNGSARILWKEDAVATGEMWGVIRIAEKPRGLFPVHVEKDGGADGDGTNPATWTYTVTTLLGDALGTALQVTRPRPNGSMIYQAGGGGYGTGFFDGPTFVLWDAGEVEATAECE